MKLLQEHKRYWHKVSKKESKPRSFSVCPAGIWSLHFLLRLNRNFPLYRWSLTQTNLFVFYTTIIQIQPFMYLWPLLNQVNPSKRWGSTESCWFESFHIFHICPRRIYSAPVAEQVQTDEVSHQNELQSRGCEFCLQGFKLETWPVVDSSPVHIQHIFFFTLFSCVRAEVAL